ncbi:BREX-2 system phosphatase PglZ [Kocuria sp. CPCC 205268]|uniref:BREX-2 system phosphatase PglZ n=1 Tax=Kocuria oxytropis TaxID=3058913 RepID=UPI0034D3E9D6
MVADVLAAPAVTGAAVAAVVARVEGTGRHHNGGVLGIRAVPDPDVTVARPSPAGHRIQVEACPSTLAIWDALHRWDGTGWLVVLTDRPEDDLGPGTLARLVDHRLLTPDPWEAAMQVFGARTLQRALLAEGRQSDLPSQLVAITPDDGWPTAPGGVLTREHVFASVAVKYLGLPLGADAPGILQWTTRPEAVSAVSTLRARTGDALTDAVLGWLADQAGPARRPVLHLLERGRLGEILPAGLALHVLRYASRDLREEAQTAAVRLTERLWSGLDLRSEEAEGLGTLCEVTVQELLERTTTREAGEGILGRTDRVLIEVSAPAVARRSGLLPSSLDAAYDVLGRALANGAQGVESAWQVIDQHPLARGTGGRPDPRRAPAEAGVRITRWIAHLTEAGESADLVSLTRRQSADDAWVDAAVNTAARGVDAPDLAVGLEAVVGRALELRRGHDREFARALADEGTATGRPLRGAAQGDGTVWRIEELAHEVIAPIAREEPTLVLLLDGMSTGAATQVLDSVLQGGAQWTELVPAGTTRRASALAVLPSLTEHSRTSFFSGRPVTGGQSEERAGFSETARAAGHHSGKLFHKAPLDTRRAGFQLAPDVADAMADVSRHRLVGCVLNTIDDALDRSDPAGTVWNEELVKHLRPLLAAAHAAGRTVILTADHGHVVERRAGTKLPATAVSSARSRAAEEPAREGEILVSGPRVLSHDGTAVLVVDEHLRYSTLKAGYHGGGSPAEVVVPVVVLTPTATVVGDEIRVADWASAPSQQPVWWNLAPAGTPPAAPEPAPETSGQGEFDLFEPSSPQRVGEAVVGTERYADQRKISGRVSLSDTVVAGLLDALLGADGHRIAAPAVASLLRIPQQRVQFAVGQVQKLLNVEGYRVVRMDGGMLVLDAPLLAQQFGVAV